jgi:hypothetical protein
VVCNVFTPVMAVTIVPNGAVRIAPTALVCPTANLMSLRMRLSMRDSGVVKMAPIR